jgi:hypothetical protein
MTRFYGVSHATTLCIVAQQRAGCRHRTVEGSPAVLRDRWIDVRADDCITSAGVKVSPYYVLTYPDWVRGGDNERRNPWYWSDSTAMRSANSFSNYRGRRRGCGRSQPLEQAARRELERLLRDPRVEAT